MKDQVKWWPLTWSRGGIGLAVSLAISPTALAQMPDFCASPLSRQTPSTVALDWRLRCTIQKLVAERVQEADRATQDEVEIARLAALLKSTQTALDDANKKIAEMTHAIIGTDKYRREHGLPPYAAPIPKEHK